MKYMTYELELVEAVDSLTELMGNFQNQILSGDLKSFTLRQLYYIELINKHQNISVSEIAKMLDVKKSTVSVAINQLIDRDIVIKIQSNEDKRFYFLRLTPKGEDIIKIHMQVHKNAIKKILNVLNEDEVKSFIKIVDKITGSGL
jgi:Transcriptional regulators